MAKKFLAFIPMLLGQIYTEPLEATVGAPVMISCLLPNLTNLNWFYWEESNITVYHYDVNQKETTHSSYERRIEVFKNEFSFGNISLRLLNVGVGDDQKNFTAAVKFYQHERLLLSNEWCKRRLQVSAPYSDPELTLNKTQMLATCTIRGGYPQSRMSWKGVNKSSAAEQDLNADDMSQKQDPTTKTYTMSSSVTVGGLQSVTCFVYDPHSKKEKNTTLDITEENHDLTALWRILVPVAVVAIVVAVVTVLAIFCCRQRIAQSRGSGGCYMEMELRARTPLKGKSK
ncbi:putative selection and upkeep of intraepithelial T-cells protein 1 homolog [Antennarius striatus]|uniref:putative selection and upkeep of intraepithelial T-cells protein 1 homolog n=1 Tax=Antennarius striatus TaxID=241820 RepID=UPI0035B0D5B8